MIPQLPNQSVPRKIWKPTFFFGTKKNKKKHTLGRHLQGCSSSSFGDPREKRLAGEEISLVKRGNVAWSDNWLVVGWIS